MPRFSKPRHISKQLDRARPPLDSAGHPRAGPVLGQARAQNPVDDASRVVVELLAQRGRFGRRTYLFPRSGGGQETVEPSRAPASGLAIVRAQVRPLLPGRPRPPHSGRSPVFANRRCRVFRRARIRSGRRIEDASSCRPCSLAREGRHEEGQLVGCNRGPPPG